MPKYTSCICKLYRTGAKKYRSPNSPGKKPLIRKTSLAIRRMFGFNPVNTGMSQSHQLFPIRLF